MEETGKTVHNTHTTWTMNVSAGQGGAHSRAGSREEMPSRTLGQVFAAIIVSTLIMNGFWLSIIAVSALAGAGR